MEQLNELVEAQVSIESRTKDSMILEFGFLLGNAETAQKRIYPTKVLTAAVAALNERISKGAAIYGTSKAVKELELPDVSHRILSARMKGDMALARVEILPTDKGLTLQKILAHGGRFYAGSRGFGIEKTEGAVTIVQDGYQLAGIDFSLERGFPQGVGVGNVVAEKATVFGYLYEPIRGLTQEELQERYRNSQKAGYKGSFSDYLKIFREA